MDFNTLHETIPYAKGGKEKILRYSPYPNIVLAMPGRHAQDTVPVGGDFVVMVTDPTYPVTDHQFTHTDIFKDIELKQTFHEPTTELIMKDYLDLIANNANCLEEVWNMEKHFNYPGIDPDTFLCAVQCLAVAEHRRYAKYEPKFGGRYLPFRFAAGIAQGLWGAADAANLQRKGRPGVEILEKAHGVPTLTQELMK